jgi:hypothetical protein
MLAPLNDPQLRGLGEGETPQAHWSPSLPVLTLIDRFRNYDRSF